MVDIRDALSTNEKLLDEQEMELVRMLLEEGQEHLFAAWPPAGDKDVDKRRLLAQLRHLDGNYSGGLRAYLRNSKRLLEDSRLGRNPFEGYVPSVPHGEKLDFGSDRCNELEEKGVEAAADAAFMLVAGGLGERLGYSGIKVALPSDLARGACFLQLYIENILALQAKAAARGRAVRMQLAIMTSDDTHARTDALLRKHAYFGAEPDQIHMLKQEKVACLADGEAHLALEKDDPFALQTKPHGHGDAHGLLHSSGLATAWLKAGVRWVCFFQDTNGLVFRALPTALGVSVENDYDVNSLAVPRRAKEAIGAIALLLHNEASGHSMTVNVEYNQLDPLLRATVSPEGDVNDDTGFSPYPGNINQLVLKLEPYVAQLEANGGVIAEFVNPKYADAERVAFKSATRLECMMQDYPKQLPATASVGFTVINQVWAAYSPVKNSPADARAKVAGGTPSHSATTGELDIYAANCRMLQMVGAEVAGPTPAVYNGLEVERWPLVSWSPSFAQTFADLRRRVTGGAVSIGANSAVVVEGDVTLKALRVVGALEAKAVTGAEAVLDGMSVENAGWVLEPLPDDDEAAPEEEQIRGFRLVRRATEALRFDQPRLYYVPAEQAAAVGAAQ